MNVMTAGWIAEAVGGDLHADPEILVTSVVRDSRDVTKGSLFVALWGERLDGHDYVGTAASAGAAVHLVSVPVELPHILVADTTVALGLLAGAYLETLRAHGDVTVIAITGSVGKTTTKDLLAQILPSVMAPIGSYNNEIGLPLTVLEADSTTRFLVLEMGASGLGHITYLTAIAPPDVVVVLVVGQAHMGEYDSIDDIAKAKAEIIEGRAPGATVVLNADDPRVAAMASLAPEAIMFGVGTTAADVRAEGLRTDGGRARFEVIHGADRADVALRLVGEHHVTNALAATAVALVCGIPLVDVAARLNAAEPVSPHRMALTERADGVTILDDSYNASPESMRAALRALRDVGQGGRTFAVLGEMLEMGDASVAAHDEVGHLVVRLCVDHLLVVGTGARATYDAAVREGSFGDEAAYVDTISEAATYLESRVKSGDTVLVKASHGAGLWRLADDLVKGNP